MSQQSLPNRRSIRVHDYDYAQNGAYFVTICAAQRQCLFGDVADEVMRCSTLGDVVATAWCDLPHHTPGLILDAWVIMPNHLHGIVILTGAQASNSLREDKPRGPRPRSLGAVIGGFKSAVSRQFSDGNLSPIRPLWQRNYYERIIRNDHEFDATRRYIESNPARWAEDPNHPRFHSHVL